MKPCKPIVSGILNQKPFFWTSRKPRILYCCFNVVFALGYENTLGISPQNIFLPKIKAILQEDLHKKHGRAEFFGGNFIKEMVHYAIKTGSQSFMDETSIAQGIVFMWIVHQINKSQKEQR